jgi:hypothetical protein
MSAAGTVDALFEGLRGDRVRLQDYPNLRGWVHRLPENHDGRLELDALLDEANQDGRSTSALAFGMGLTVGLLAGVTLCGVIAVLA